VNVERKIARGVAAANHVEVAPVAVKSKLAKPLASSCSCDKCSHGCTMGSGFFIDEQLPKVAKFLKISEDKLKKQYLEKPLHINLHRPKFPKPFGKCVFFDGKKCKIHKVKPLQCKISSGCSGKGVENNKWFIENHILQKKKKNTLFNKV
jgi:Fe-S-cluster containining protein